MLVKKAFIDLELENVSGLEKKINDLKIKGYSRITFKLKNLNNPLLGQAVDFAHQHDFNLIGLASEGDMAYQARRLVSSDKVTFFNRPLFEAIEKINYFLILFRPGRDQLYLNNVLSSIRNITAIKMGALNNSKLFFLEVSIPLNDDNHQFIAENIRLFMQYNIERIRLEIKPPIKSFDAVKKSIDVISQKAYLSSIWLSLRGAPLCLLWDQAEHLEDLFRPQGQNPEPYPPCQTCAFGAHCPNLAEAKTYFKDVIKPLQHTDRLGEIIKLRTEVTG